MPEDPAAAQRDPTVIMWWLTRRVGTTSVPERQVVLEMAVFGPDGAHSWLLLARDTEPVLCREDPFLDGDRYIYVEVDSAALFPIARGLRDWTEAMADGSVHVYGDPDLVQALPGWFAPAAAPSTGALSSARPTAA